MSTDSTNTKPNTTTEMGISFNEIHSDEPHETVTAQKMNTTVSQTSSEKPTSHLSNHGQVFNVSKAYEAGHIEAGTIVSDKKRSRPGLVENLRSAMNEWWGTTKKTFEQAAEEIPRPKKEEKPVVAKVETRVEVVKKAVEKAAFAPKDDHKVVIQKIRTFKQDVARATGTPIVLKEPDQQESAWKSKTQISTPEKTLTKVDLRHATIAPYIKSIPTPPKSSHSIPTPPPSKTASIFLPPTVTKKVLPTPQYSTTLAPRVQSVKNITSAPLAPSWHQIADEAAGTPEKPHMYTKKDFEGKIPTPEITPLSKPPLSNLKPETNAEQKMIHESMVTPTPDTISIPQTRTTSTVSQPIQKRDKLDLVPRQKPQPVTPSVIKASAPKPIPTKILPSKTPDPLQIKQSPFVETRSNVPQPKEAVRPVSESVPRAVVTEQTQAPISQPYIPAQEILQSASVPSFRSVPADLSNKVAPSIPSVTPAQPPHMTVGQTIALFQNPAIRKLVRWGILAFVAIVGVTLAVVLSIYFKVFAPNEDIQTEILTIPSFFTTESQTGVPLTGEPKAFLNILNETLMQTSGARQLYPTQKEGEGFRIATAPEVLTFLETHVAQKTIRALDNNIMIGSITTTKNEPFIILRSYNFDTLFSGLLLWEEYMYEDLAPLFGTEPMNAPRFKDAVRDNTSTRILYDANGAEVMLYSFINQNTVVITSSGDALAEIIKRF